MALSATTKRELRQSVGTLKSRLESLTAEVDHLTKLSEVITARLDRKTEELAGVVASLSSIKSDTGVA